MISVLLNRNNFIKNLLTAKSNNFKSLFVSAKHSRPYISIIQKKFYIIFAVLLKFVNKRRMTN